MYQAQTLSHADQSETLALVGSCWIKSNSIVADGQPNFSFVSDQLYIVLLCLAVLDSILQRLLKHAVQAERGVLGQIAGNSLAPEIYLHSLPGAKLPAEDFSGGCKTKVLK